MAANIDQAIDEARGDIFAIAFGGAASLFTRMNTWIAGMWGPAGIFTDLLSDAERTIVDWHIFNLIAASRIESQVAGTGLPGETGSVGASAVTDAVVRTLFAVKFAEINGWITTVQRDAVVTLYQGTWD